jgi:hypothetical protein
VLHEWLYYYLKKNKQKLDVSSEGPSSAVEDLFGSGGGVLNKYYALRGNALPELFKSGGSEMTFLAFRRRSVRHEETSMSFC